MLQPDLLQGYEVFSQFAAPFEDCGIGALGKRAPVAPATLSSCSPLSSAPLSASLGLTSIAVSCPFSLPFSMRLTLIPLGQSELSSLGPSRPGTHLL